MGKVKIFCFLHLEIELELLKKPKRLKMFTNELFV